jgi:hypothetical protein
MIKGVILCMSTKKENALKVIWTIWLRKDEPNPGQARYIGFVAGKQRKQSVPAVGIVELG